MLLSEATLRENSLVAAAKQAAANQLQQNLAKEFQQYFAVINYTMIILK